MRPDVRPDVRPDTSQRLLGLELLRFLAALGVLVWHYQHFMFAGHAPSDLNWARLPVLWLFAPFYTDGYAGVELFWCISGFIFTWKYGPMISPGSGLGRLSFRRFVLLRFSRLYPLHLATLFIVLLLQRVYRAVDGETFVYQFNDTWHFVLNLCFANWWGLQSGSSFNGPSWSVSAEVLIYAVFFWITRWAGAGWRADMWTAFGFCVAPWIAQHLFAARLTFTEAGLFFYLGALTCHLHDWTETLEPRSRWCIGFGCIGLIAGCSHLVAIQAVKMPDASVPMFPAAVLLVQLTVRPRGKAVQAWLTGLGNLTYASYMLHFPMQLAAVLILGALSVSIESVFYTDWFMLAYLGSVLGTAVVAFHWIERPAQAWLRIVGSRSRVPGSGLI